MFVVRTVFYAFLPPFSIKRSLTYLSASWYRACWISCCMGMRSQANQIVWISASEMNPSFTTWSVTDSGSFTLTTVAVLGRGGTVPASFAPFTFRSGVISPEDSVMIGPSSI